MGRGEHPRQNHHKKIQIPEIQITGSKQMECDLGSLTWNLIRSYWKMLDSIELLFLENK
jgi:hypothetical protein